MSTLLGMIYFLDFIFVQRLILESQWHEECQLQELSIEFSLLEAAWLNYQASCLKNRNHLEIFDYLKTIFDYKYYKIQC